MLHYVLCLLCLAFVVSRVCHVQGLLCLGFVVSRVCHVLGLLCLGSVVSRVCHVQGLSCLGFVVSKVCRVQGLSVQGLFVQGWLWHRPMIYEGKLHIQANTPLLWWKCQPCYFVEKLINSEVFRLFRFRFNFQV